MSPTKIFIVEDEQIIAMGIEACLVYAGYEVVGMASSGEKALVKISTSQPDLVLMDINLAAAMDGIETAEQVTSKLNIPVIFLTAFNDDATLKRAQNSNPFGYLTKPCDDRDLIPAIEIALARHRSESVIRSALEKEQELLELKSRFISMISHEFRNPLATIMSSQELIELSCQNGNHEKINVYSDRIAKSVRRLEILIRDVLTLAKTESHEFEFDPKAIDLLNFCQELIEEFRLRTDDKHVIEFECRDCGDRIFNLDTKLLEHILSNLLSNAIKYSPNGGTISLVLSCNVETICFQVKDSGIGIPEEAQPKLFEAFQRAKNVGKIPGTGLGLAIVKQCVELHNGQISFESSSDRGTTFMVTLPRKSAECLNSAE
jgi:signal transduction histidine kinase